MTRVKISVTESKGGRCGGVFKDRIFEDFSLLFTHLDIDLLTSFTQLSVSSSRPAQGWLKASPQFSLQDPPLSIFEN